MSKNIKRIAHDLMPLSDASKELSKIISQLMRSIKSHAKFDDPKACEYFAECIEASEKLAISTTLIKSYIQEVNDEADREGIIKN